MHLVFRSMKISVLNITNKPGGIDVLKDNLDKQTVEDFELIIIDALYDWRKEEVRQYFEGAKYRVIHRPEPPKGTGDAWALNKSYNEGLRASGGTLIVSLQDYIWIPADGLEKFWDTWSEYGSKAAVCGIGHKALYPNKYDDLGGKISIWQEPYRGVPEGISEADHRWDGKRQVEEISRNLFELNWAAVPRQGFFDIGGFDEEYDQGYSCDNFNISFRLSLIEYRFFLDKTNECIGFNQRDIFPRPTNWEQRHNRYHRHPKTIRDIISKEKSWKLNYV